MSSDIRELLGIDHLELQFPFEINKQISCSLQLTNKTDDYVAFKVKTTSPKKYCVRPNNGIVTPQSMCDVAVTMQAQREAPPDMQCKDKFLVQSAIVSKDLTPKDITGDMFTKESGNVVDEVKLKVVYVLPLQPPTLLHEGSGEGSSPPLSVSGVGSLSHQEATRTSDDESQLFSATRAQKGPEVVTSEPSTLISRLTEEKNFAIQQNIKLRDELDLIRREINKQHSGFSFVFVVVVALLGILLGFLMKR